MLTHRLPNGCALRLLEEDDAEELYAVIAHNRAHLARWMPWAAGEDLEAAKAFIAATRRQVGENDGLQLAIVDEDGRIAGVAGMHRIDWAARSTTIGYWLAEDAQGRGTMTEAVRALVDHAFGIWDLHRVEIQAAVENHRSRAVPQRLGFREEGTLREAARLGDRWLDHVVYAVLATEWLPQ